MCISNNVIMRISSGIPLGNAPAAISNILKHKEVLI